MKLILSAVLAVCVASAAQAQVCPNGVCPRARLPLPMAGAAPAAYGGGFFAASRAGPVRKVAGGVAGWVRSHRPHLRRGGCR